MSLLQPVSAFFIKNLALGKSKKLMKDPWA